MSSLQNKVAVLTGGSRGIGAATARLLGSRGANVVVNYAKNAEAATQVVAAIEASGGHAIAVQGDVGIEADVHRLIAETMKVYGRVDALISNAGTDFAQKDFADFTWDEFSQDVTNELKGAFLLTQAVLPIMKEQKYGRLVYVGSGTGKAPTPKMLSHGTGKAALFTLCQYIASEVGPFGMTANLVAPGLTETDATAHVPQHIKQMLANMAPLRRIARPEDVAGAIAFYASDESQFMTGTYAPVDGGLMR